MASCLASAARVKHASLECPGRRQYSQPLRPRGEGGGWRGRGGEALRAAGGVILAPLPVLLFFFCFLFPFVAAWLLCCGGGVGVDVGAEVVEVELVAVGVAAEVVVVVVVAVVAVAAEVLAAAVGEVLVVVLVVVERVGGVNPSRLGRRRLVLSLSHHCFHLSDELQTFSHEWSIHEPAAEVPMVRVFLLASASLALLSISMKSNISSA